MTEKEACELGERILKSEESDLSEEECFEYDEACIYRVS